MKAYINHINNYPVDSTACFVNTHSLESDLTGGHSLGKNCVPDGKCIVRDQVSGLIAYNDMLSHCFVFFGKTVQFTVSLSTQGGYANWSQ